MVRANQLNKTFVFKYDPDSSLEKMLDNFQAATEGKLKLVEPNVLRCNDLGILLSNMNEIRWEIFQTLVNEKPNSLKKLSQILQKDYNLVKQESENLATLGIIELHQQKEEIQPTALYKKIDFDLRAVEQQKNNLLTEEIEKHQIRNDILSYQQSNKLSAQEMAKKLNIEEKIFYNIYQGKLTDFSSEKLLNWSIILNLDYFHELRENRGMFVSL